MQSTIIATFLLISIVNGYFVLVNPVGRGLNKALAYQAPCGGFNTTLRGTTLYSGQPFTFKVLDGYGNVTFSYSSSDDFFFVYANAGGPMSVDSAVNNGMYTTSVRLTSGTGSLGIIQLTYQDNNRNIYYQCFDMIVDQIPPSPVNIISPASQLAPIATIFLILLILLTLKSIFIG